VVGEASVPVLRSFGPVSSSVGADGQSLLVAEPLPLPGSRVNFSPSRAPRLTAALRFLSRSTPHAGHCCWLAGKFSVAKDAHGSVAVSMIWSSLPLHGMVIKTIGNACPLAVVVGDCSVTMDFRHELDRAISTSISHSRGSGAIPAAASGAVRARLQQTTSRRCYGTVGKRTSGCRKWWFGRWTGGDSVMP